MKKFLLCLSLVFYVTFSFAQSREIKGTVTDQSGKPLSANVSIKGSKYGNNANAAGEFTLKVPSKIDTGFLFVSFVGFKTQLIPFTKSNSVFNIKLEAAETNAGEEVVVIGYQTMKRKDIPGGIATIGAKDLKDVVVSSAEEAITGKLAGVQVTTSEGAPGSQVQIQVRGGGSVTQDNSPMYIIDGIESDEGISMIAPQDIESIDVLKDASATSIYGARAANGVVVVTTKGGKNTKGKMTVSYNGLFGLNQLSKKLEVMNPYDFVMLQYDRSKFSTDTSTFTSYGKDWQALQSYKKVPFYDWQKKMFGRDALQQTHNVSLSGGNLQTQYYLSLTSNAQDGIFQNSEYDRKLISFKFDHKASDNVKLGFSVRYNKTTVDGSGTTDPSGDQSLSFLRQIIRYKPFISGQTADVTDPTLENATGGNGLTLINPILLNNGLYKNNVTDNFVMNGYLNYQLTKRISFRSTIGYDIADLQQNAFNDAIEIYSRRYSDSMPNANITRHKKVIINNSNVLTYASKNTENPFTLLVGEETYENVETNNYIQSLYMPLGITPKTALANMSMSTPNNNTERGYYTSSAENTIHIWSFFSSAKFSYHKKYQFSASVRADGASVFAKKWGTFTSAGFSWLLSKEKFMDKVNNYLTDVKLRVSIGAVGNAKIKNNLFGEYYTSSDPASAYALGGILNPGFNSSNLPNRNLQWEATLSRNFGLDFGIFKNRFQVSLDLYSNTTDKLLVKVPLPQSAGYTTQIQNVGSTNNKGIELQLAGTVLRSKDFTWTFSYNISSNQNKIVSLGSQQNSYFQSSNFAGASNLPDFIVKVGQKVGSMYGYVNDGYYTTNDFVVSPSSNPDLPYIYTLKAGVASNTGVTATAVQPGSMKYKDLNGDGKVDVNDRTILGSNQPLCFGGLTQTFKYKDWDASIFVNYRVGGNVVNDNKLEFTSAYTPNANMLAIMNNRWKMVDANGVTYQKYDGTSIYGKSKAEIDDLNKNSSIWLPSTGSSSSAFSPMSFALEDATFLRINNITVGYSIPSNTKFMRKMSLTKLRVYATVNNLAVITSYTGYDPEVNTRRETPLTPGVDYSAYPRSIGYVCGINVNF